MALDPSDLTKGLDKIAQEVADHCIHGEQSKNLVDSLACGQFYGDNVRERTQRGLHGTAAAINILLLYSERKYVNIANKLMIYVKSRISVDSTDESLNGVERHDDDLNVVKQAEILASINDLVDDPEYIHKLAIKLRSYQDEANGTWGFYAGDNEPSDVATCYALLALYKRIPYDEFSKSRQYLWKQQASLEERSKAADPDAIARRSLILFTLAKVLNGYRDNNIKDNDISSVINRFWKVTRRQFIYPYEVTIEYYRADTNHYLRIPWQIYLAHAIVLVDNTNYYSRRFQSYADSLYKSAISGGYAYVQAGPYLSTRTNSILYDFLNYLSNLKPTKSKMFIAYDYVNEMWAKSWVRFIIVFSAGFSALYFSDRYTAEINDRSPFWVETIASIGFSVAAWMLGSGKKDS